jgi:hypothetical protein
MIRNAIHIRETGAIAAAKATNADRMVIERLAENASQCQCLAAWDDSRKCICGDTRIEVPLSISATKQAARIISQIESLDHRIAETRKIERDVVRCYFNPKRQNPEGGWFVRDGHHEPEVAFSIPKQMLLAIMQTERIDLIRQLQETGIVSIDLHNVKVRPE